MKAIEPGDIEQRIATGDTFHLIVDITRASIHAGWPDGHLDYFNRDWLESAMPTQ